MVWLLICVVWCFDCGLLIWLICWLVQYLVVDVVVFVGLGVCGVFTRLVALFGGLIVFLVRWFASW